MGRRKHPPFACAIPSGPRAPGEVAPIASPAVSAEPEVLLESEETAPTQEVTEAPAPVVSGAMMVTERRLVVLPGCITHVNPGKVIRDPVILDRLRKQNVPMRPVA